ncbi:MAG TPA: hypothetical protein VGX49_01165, partial [Jatrophihabitans sp.]|nr:hypothetical protein [Jatrophihabitans sp.]
MLTTRWAAAGAVEPGADYTVLAGRLPVRCRRDLPAVLEGVWRIERALVTAEGLAGHRAGVDLAELSVWTVSVWASRGQLTRFERGEIHRRVEAALRPRLLPARFAVWTCQAAD